MELELKKISKLSEKLKEYIKRIEEETGRPVLIKSVQDVGLNGMNAVFKLDPKYIHVEIIEEKYYDSKGEIDQEGIECVIAHEVTHGLLAYKKKYCQLDIDCRCNKLEEDSIKRLISMIEDLVVDKIMHENNFQILPKRYIKRIKDEIEDLRKGKDCYEKFNKYFPIYKDRFMIYQYMLAWGVLKYFKLIGINKKTICEFLKIFQKSCPRQYEEAEKIKEIVLKNDIFTPEGYRKTIEECLELWNLTDLVNLYTY